MPSSKIWLTRHPRRNLAGRKKTGYRRHMAKKIPSEAPPKHNKFTIYLPEKTIYELKVFAAKERTSCSALIEQCVTKHMAEHKSAGK